MKGSTYLLELSGEAAIDKKIANAMSPAPIKRIRCLPEVLFRVAHIVKQPMEK
jgi:hypothetical protein